MASRFLIKNSQKMKKVSLVLFVLLCTVLTNSFAQTATTPTIAPASPAKEATDFFAGKWEISILGTPNGDSKMVTTLVRKDGKLTGELKDVSDASKPAIPITSIEEEEGQITIGFSVQGYDLSLPLKKVDDNNLEGKLMDMFDTKAVRIKE